MRGRKPDGFRYGLVALFIIGIGTYLGFTKDIPFTRPFQIDAVFESANSIRPGSPVRIAGVNVGKVASVKPIGDEDAAMVTLSLTDEGLPIHADARAKIRPRIFLEGNFFVDLSPGSPGAPVLDDGDDIPITNTATPVQIDEVLTALQDPEREDLRTLLDELGRGVDRGAKSFNRAYDDIAAAERDTSIFNRAFAGTDPERDLPRLIEGLAGATEGLGRNEEQLGDLVTDFSTTMGAFAAERDALEDTIRELGPTLDTTNVALARINDALPPLRAFAIDLVPGVRETPATIEAGLPWIAETRRLLAPEELSGLARDLAPSARDTAGLVRATLGLLPEADAFARCVSDTLVPAGDQVIRDRFSTGQPNYREFLYSLVGFAGEGASFDGNGSYVRFQPGGGGETVALGPPNAEPLLANVFPGTRTQPKMPASKPPVVGTVPCAQSELPAVNGPAAAVGSFGRPAAISSATPTPTATETRHRHRHRDRHPDAVIAIRKHFKDFAAILVLVLLASVVSTYILSNQRLTLPAWVPVIGKDWYEFKGEFTTAQAVTPGQGQTVNIAGVKVGEISEVELRDGRAVIGMRLDDPAITVYRDATMLLRPKTGLKDMTVELNPGSREAGALPEDGTIPVAQTAPDVNLDEFLAALDGDTRTWLKVLLASGAEGLRGRGRDLGDTIRQFGPTARALREINDGLAERRRNIARVTHNFSLLAEELGKRDDDLARFVSSNGAVLRVLAEQETNIQATIAELPEALRSTREGLGRVGEFSLELGPALTAIRPGARALEPMQQALQPFFRETTPIIRDSVRPLVRAARPVAQELRPAMTRLSGATEGLVDTITVLNALVDRLAYNPPGDREGYLFWLAWLNHLGANVFNAQDAHGPIRRGAVVINCAQRLILDQVAATNQTLGAIIGLSNLPDSQKVCTVPQGGTR